MKDSLAPSSRRYCITVRGRTYLSAKRNSIGEKTSNNPERPHKSLGQDVPASRYQLSSIPFPALLPSIEYGPDDIVRKVHYNGELHFKGNIFHLSKALRGHPVGLRPTSTDGLFDVYLCYQKISTVDLNNL